MLKELAQTNCVSQDPHPKKSIPRKEGQMGGSHEVQFSRRTWHTIKNGKANGLSSGIIQKCEPQERSPCAPTFAERSQEDTLQQERCARGVAWNLANISFKLKKLYGAMLYFFIENWANEKNERSAWTHFTINRGARIRG